MNECPAKQLADLGMQVGAVFTRARDQLRSFDESRIDAGRLLLKAKAIYDASPGRNDTWREWCESNSGRSYRDCNKCMAYASAEDPMAALQADREASREAMRRKRAAGSNNTDVRPDGIGVQFAVSQVERELAAVVIEHDGDPNMLPTGAAKVVEEHGRPLSWRPTVPTDRRIPRQAR
jgi:hypothetical protein